MTNGINSINFNSNILANNNAGQAKTSNLEDEQVFEFGKSAETAEAKIAEDKPEEGVFQNFWNWFTKFSMLQNPPYPLMPTEYYHNIGKE